MIPSNNHNGFTFIEIVLTVALIGAVLAPLFSVQYNVLRLITRASDRVSRIFLLGNIFQEAEYKDKPVSEKGLTGTKKITDPETDLTYIVKTPDKSSSLKKLHDVYIVQTTATWNRAGIAYKENMLSFMYQPKPKKKKEAQSEQPKAKQ